LKELGALDQMKQVVPPKKYGNYLPTQAMMTGEHWATDAPAAKGAEDE